MKMEFTGYVTFSCIMLTVIAQVLSCDITNCNASNGTVCNEQGTCDCGVCKCKGSYSGPTCEECPTCPSPCEIYKDCVGCKIFGTGPLGPMACLLKCEEIATFLPVDKSDFDNSDDERILCRTLFKTLDDNKACMEMFRIGGMTDGYRDLFVRTEHDCNVKYIPTHPPVIEIPMGTESVKKSGSDDGRQEKPEDAGAVSGTNKGQQVGDNSAALRTVSKFLIIVMAVLSSFL